MAEIGRMGNRTGRRGPCVPTATPRRDRKQGLPEASGGFPLGCPPPGSPSSPVPPPGGLKSVPVWTALRSGLRKQRCRLRARPRRSGEKPAPGSRASAGASAPTAGLERLRVPARAPAQGTPPPAHHRFVSARGWTEKAASQRQISVSVYVPLTLFDFVKPSSQRASISVYRFKRGSAASPRKVSLRTAEQSRYL